VVVPIFNAGKKLDKCIKSILNQTFLDFELVLVNDGSTDNSLEKIRSFQKSDNRIIVIDKQNEGCFLTRKRGVLESKSKYIIFVDADDWIEKTTIDILYDEMIKSDSDITVSNLYKVLGGSNLIKRNNNSRYFNESKTYNKNDIRNELIVAYFHGHPFPSSLCAKMYKRELLITSGKYLDRIKFLGEDLYYNLELFLKANTVKVVNQTLYYYRMGGFTNKYMPYLFDDMVNGYKIQKEVINEYFMDTLQKQYNGISIMLLNTFKTCLCNLFKCNLSEIEKREIIRKYTLNESVNESIENKGAINYFSDEYLRAIKNGDVNYLYNLGKQLYNKNRPKRIAMKMVSAVL
jgi:glycosyltransferase involved in cell wall biosynthesis